MPPSEKKTGMPLPRGILTPTTQPEEVISNAGQGGEAEGTGRDESVTPEAPKAPRTRKKRTPASDKTEGRRLYLSEGVHFRLRMLAYQRKQKISEVAEDVLDK